MNVVLFGATGMIGQGVLRECLLAPDVKSILAVVRSATDQQHEKLRARTSTAFEGRMPPAVKLIVRLLVHATW